MSYGTDWQEVYVWIVMKSGSRFEGKVREDRAASLMRAVRTGNDSDPSISMIRTKDGELSFRPSEVETLLTPVGYGP